MIITIKPRGLTTEQAAAYCGADSVEQFLAWVGLGLVPGPHAVLGVYDRLLCDRPFDEAVGVSSPPQPTRACKAVASSDPIRTLNLKGVNKVKKTLADGTEKFLYYHRYTKARLPDDPASPEFAFYVDRLNREWKEQGAQKTDRPTAGSANQRRLRSLASRRLKTISDLIRAYHAAPDWMDLAKSTRTIEAYNIKAIEKEWGATSLSDIEKRGARTMFLEWHDEPSQEQPRGADAKLARLARIFAFGVDREHLAVHPLASFKRAYKGDRSEIIWLPEHVRQFTATAKQSLCDALALAFHTGQRRGDLLALRWSNFDGKAISLTQSKTGARVYIPCTRALLQTLARLKDDYEARIEAAEMRGEGETVVDTILTNNASAWTIEAFKQAWRYAYLSAWPAPATPPDLHFHDLRGTAVTMLAEAGCTVPEIAAITGHSMESAARILERYLGATKVMAENAIAKLEVLHAKRDVGVSDG